MKQTASIRIAFKTNGTESQLRLISQMGVTDIVVDLPREFFNRPWPVKVLEDLRKQVEDKGMKLSVLEGFCTSPSSTVKMGLAKRDADIEVYCENIRSMGKAGIPILCYNWMPVYNWIRSDHAIVTRGGALVTGYNHEKEKDWPQTEYGEVSEAQLWEGLEYFLKAVLPVAEEAGVKLSMHPSDPPRSPVRGLPRIMTSPEDFQRLLDMYPSLASGITFCQGCFLEMGKGLEENIRRFSESGKIFYVHFRDVRGSPGNFVETFHDDGPNDMYAAMKTYYDCGFEGPMRPDHGPTMEGESNDFPGYGVMGRLFAVGYMRGLLESIERTGP